TLRLSPRGDPDAAISSSRFRGRRRSISSIILSAHRLESAMPLTVAGILARLSYCASFRAARIEAPISSTRFLPSSTNTSLAYSLFVRYSDFRGSPNGNQHSFDAEYGAECRKYETGVRKTSQAR